MAKKIKIKKRRNGTVTALMKPEVERHFCSSGGSGEEASVKMQNAVFTKGWASRENRR